MTPSRPLASPPGPTTGSSLVTETILQLGEGWQLSVAETVMETGTSL